MRARELAAWSAANTLADAVRVAIERLDGPASVRNPAEALDILQTALGIAQAGIDVVHDRATGPLVDDTDQPPFCNLECSVETERLRQRLAAVEGGLVSAAQTWRPMKGASS